jgi:hypothetical protein
MTVILATQKLEIRRITVQSQPGQIVCETLSRKKTIKIKGCRPLPHQSTDLQSFWVIALQNHWVAALPGLCPAGLPGHLHARLMSAGPPAHQASNPWTHQVTTRQLPACRPPQEVSNTTRCQLQTCLGDTDKQDWMLKE